MMTFSEKLTELRKREGLSQETVLADRLGVTRQSVSKWESGTAVPEIVKLISLSDIYSGVSIDYLVKDAWEEPETAGQEPSSDTARLEQKVDDLTRYVKRKDWMPYAQQDAAVWSAAGLDPDRLRSGRSCAGKM